MATGIGRGGRQNLKFLLAVGAAAGVLGLAPMASAYEAYVTASEPLQAGPSPDYPPIADLSVGEPVNVYGCIDGWSWCDVSFQGYRGWFDASQLAYPYEGQRVPLFEYGVRIGIPVIGFSFDDYWGRYYRDRPFYGERERYAHFQPRPFAGGEHGRESGPGRNPGPPADEHGRQAGPEARPEAARGAPQPDGAARTPHQEAAQQASPAGHPPQPDRQAAHPAPRPAPAPRPQAAPHPQAAPRAQPAPHAQERPAAKPAEPHGEEEHH